MNDEERLSELSQFLRTRRERLGPADIGLAPGRRRRTPGLRREEVAQLAGVSATWYTWLEQGRPVRASEAVLERLGRVLRLDPAEHRHLFVLARGHPPADPTDAPAIVDSRLQTVLDALPYPAYAATNGWTVVAWNRAARLVFADYEALSGRERNIVWMAFTDPDHRRMAVNWEEQARSTLALFPGEHRAERRRGLAQAVRGRPRRSQPRVPRVVVPPRRARDSRGSQAVRPPHRRSHGVRADGLAV